MPAAAISRMTSIDSVRLARSGRAAGVSCATIGVAGAEEAVLALTELIKSRMFECRARVNTGHPQNDATKHLGASDSDRVKNTAVGVTRQRVRLGNCDLLYNPER